MEKTIILEFCRKCDKANQLYCQCGQTCESQNHANCYDYGDDPVTLWQCQKCQQWLCYADGMSNNSLCDSCNEKEELNIKSIQEKQNRM